MRAEIDPKLRGQAQAIIGARTQFNAPGGTADLLTSMVPDGVKLDYSNTKSVGIDTITASNSNSVGVGANGLTLKSTLQGNTKRNLAQLKALGDAVSGNRPSDQRVEPFQSPVGGVTTQPAKLKTEVGHWPIVVCYSLLWERLPDVVRFKKDEGSL
jgi:hypothetical protein